jgi:hypothetical protein
LDGWLGSWCGLSGSCRVVRSFGNRSVGTRVLKFGMLEMANGVEMRLEVLNSSFVKPQIALELRHARVFFQVVESSRSRYNCKTLIATRISSKTTDIATA